MNLNPLDAEVIFVQCTKLQKIVRIIQTKSCGIHEKALVEYYQMSTYMPGFQ